MDKNNLNGAQNYIYALDIGTRSVIGMLALPEGDKVRIVALEKEQHAARTMTDGQIEDIEKVAQVVQIVTKRLEEKANCTLKRAFVAAAGRALRTQKGSAKLELDAPQTLSTEQINTLQAAAVAQAEKNIEQELGDKAKELGRFFLVGYTPTKFIIDGYPIATLQGHSGQNVQADVVATFLPGEVIESLYAALRICNLQVASITLEPIAALNAAIPIDLRLLNLALVDIGAGTSDIAICRDGGVIGYTMATIAGDEITECIMKACLVDYLTAERMKTQLAFEEDIEFTDILGLEQKMSVSELESIIERDKTMLTNEIANEIIKINGGAPSAVFLAGGGSKLAQLCQSVAKALDIDKKRVAIAGGHFKNSAVSDVVDLNDPEFTTPLGIAVSAGLGLLSDSYRIKLNGEIAKLFKNEGVSALEILMMNGYSYIDLIGKSGKNLTVDVNGKRKIYHGMPCIPAMLLVNGEEVSPSHILHAGDEIEFVAAKSGKDAYVTAAQIIKDYSAQSILVDGEAVPKTFVIKNGAFIETQKSNAAKKTAKQGVKAVKSKAGKEKVKAQKTAKTVEQQSKSAEKKPQKAEDEKGDSAQKNKAQQIASGENESGANAEQNVNLQNEKASTEHEQKNTEKAQLQNEGEQKEQRAQQTPGEKAYKSFVLNDAPLKMPLKEDKSEYYLMDLLQLSDIDFSNPSKPIEMKINGKTASFSDVLQNGDVIEIN